MSRTAAGAALPDFTAIDIDGDTVRASQYGKRPLVVLFWSSWNARSRAYARALHRCRKAYGDRFDVLTVSFDYSAHTSRRRATTDSLPGTLVCDGRSFDSPLTARLGVRYVPGLLLVDKNRRIVSRDLSADEIYNALGKLVTP